MSRLERTHKTSRWILACLCGLTLVLGTLDAGSSARAAAKKKRPAKAAAKADPRGKAGRPLIRPFDPLKAKRKPLSSSSLVTLKEDGGSTHHRHVDKRDYNELRDASMELLKRYDPATHFFVGTGRDPAPIIAFLQNLGGRDLAISFPASGGVWPGGGSTASWDHASQADFARYLGKLIPRHVPRSGRTIVLLDVTNSGKTPAGIAPKVRKWVKSEGSRSKVVKLAFTQNTLENGVKTISTAPFPGVDKYMSSPFEDVVNEFDRHEIGSDSLSDLKPRPQYAKYRKSSSAPSRAPSACPSSPGCPSCARSKKCPT
jgi:hypothetical protein